jgi:hypothetical protein
MNMFPLKRKNTCSLTTTHNSVFLGNLPIQATEEQVRTHFAAGLGEDASGTPMIDGVRIIRDNDTQVFVHMLTASFPINHLNILPYIVLLFSRWEKDLGIYCCAIVQLLPRL